MELQTQHRQAGRVHRKEGAMREGPSVPGRWPLTPAVFLAAHGRPLFASHESEVSGEDDGPRLLPYNSPLLPS